MTSLSDLARAVLLDPLDDAVKLAYADRLEEEGADAGLVAFHRTPLAGTAKPRSQARGPEGPANSPGKERSRIDMPTANGYTLAPVALRSACRASSPGGSERATERGSQGDGTASVVPAGCGVALS